MTNNIKILSTKILLPNQKQLLIDEDFDVLESNFIHIETKSFILSTVYDNLIFTSQNAVRSFLENPEHQNLKTKKTFCVGIKSKNILTEAGFEVVAYTDYASDLAEIICLIYAEDSYTFFSGNLRKETLPQMLKQAGIVFNEIEAYETQLTPQKVTTPINAILFFSPSGVESYLSNNTIKKELCFCIGETTAETLRKVTKNIIIAPQPSIEELIAEVIEEYN